MIPSNSYLQYTLIRDGGNLEHLLTLSKKSQTLLCKKITPASSDRDHFSVDANVYMYC